MFYGNTIMLTCCHVVCGCFYNATAELSGCNMWCTNLKYYLALYRKIANPSSRITVYNKTFFIDGIILSFPIW